MSFAFSFCITIWDLGYLISDFFIHRTQVGNEPLSLCYVETNHDQTRTGWGERHPLKTGVERGEENICVCFRVRGVVWNRHSYSSRSRPVGP